MRTWLVALIGALFLIAGVSPVLAEKSASLSMSATDVQFERSDGVESSGTFDTAAIAGVVEDEHNVTPLGVVNDLYSSRCEVGGRVFFTGVGLRELWVTDLTVEGTHLVYELDGYSMLGCSVFDGRLFFDLSRTGSFESGTELWETDGTTGGTRLVRDFGPDADITSRQVVGTKGLFFVVDFPAQGPTLWFSDGTAGGTTLLRNFGADVDVWGPITVAERALAIAVSPELGSELWVSNGTVAGTTVSTLLSPDEFGSGFVPRHRKPFGDRIAFELGGDVWFSDGTAAGTFRLADVAPGEAYVDPDGLTVFGDQVFFNTEGGLWISDGTPAGTTLLYDDLRMLSGSMVGGRLIFRGWTEATGWGLWISDGTAAGTAEVHDVIPGAHLRTLGNGSEVVFTARSGEATEVWLSDGTTTGTRLVKRIEAGGLQDLAVVGDRFVLGFSMPVTFAEVWLSDGTTDGTRRLPDFFPTVGPRVFGCQYPGRGFGFTPLEGRLVFGGNDKAKGLAGLWVTDGTEEGTGFVASVSGLADLVSFGDKVLFINGACTANQELHVIARDPTASVTVQDFNDARNLQSLVNAENYSNTFDAPILRLYRAYFNRDPDLNGAKYWLNIRRQNYGLLQIAGFMAGGQEFANNYTGVDDSEYLRRVYDNMLGRLYDQAGFNYWLDLLKGTNQHGLNPNHDQLTRSGVVFYITGGTEFINNYPYTK